MPPRTKKAVNSTPPISSVSSQSSSKPAPPSSIASQNHIPPVEPAQPNPRADAGRESSGNPTTTATEASTSQPTVNRKKQKRREKEAAKRAAEKRTESKSLAQNGYGPASRGSTKGYFREETDDFNHGFVDDAGDGEEAFFSGTEDQFYAHGDLLRNGFDQRGQAASATIGKKKKPKVPDPLPNLSQDYAGNSSTVMRNQSLAPRPYPPSTPSLSSAALRSAHQNFSHDQIWNTSTQAERENIKQFWLELGEEERRSLVKVEKEAVLRKMKEQQKHSCSCTVCGRKRTAIEEELEVLYDAYYEELEQFANHSGSLSDGAAIISDARAYGHLRTQRHPMAGQFPIERAARDPLQHGHHVLDDGEDEDEELYSDEEVEEIPRGPPDFFAFGNSLTVKDGILTVADDLLKNDGKHFIDMMESLAEKRMQREEATHFPSPALAHQTARQGHNHPPLDEDDDYDDEDEDDDYDSQEEDELEADEMDAMTEEQRMEEGRRMFQIFAARMFEQRVLTAYREKVARERQRKLIEELEEETRLDTQREAKKAKEAAKKKEKKKMQKQAKDEERAKKESEKAAQDAAARAVEEKKLEEQRQRKEEQRKKREAERKTAEEERLKKEAEKQRRAQEERERQQEAERRHREAKEREKKKREEARKKDREEKEAKEQAARQDRERKAKEAQERKALEEQTKREKEAAINAEREARERARQEEQARSIAKRQSVAVPPGIHPINHPSALQSPQFQVATPVMPIKAPTPTRPRHPAQQGSQSHGSSPQSQQAASTESTLSLTPSSTGIAIVNPPSASTNTRGKIQTQQPQPQQQQGQAPPPLYHPQPSAPLSPLSPHPRAGQPSYRYNDMATSSGNNGVAPAGLGMVGGMIPQMPVYPGPPTGGSHRGFVSPNGIPFPPGMNGSRQFAQGPSGHFSTPTSVAPMAPIAQKAQLPPKSQPHSRQQSTSYDRLIDAANQPAPISRPAPIGQSSNSTPDKKENRNDSDPDVEQLATQLGSKALLDDSDIPLSASSSEHVSAPGAPGSGRVPFSGFPDPKHDAFQSGNWGAFSPNGPMTGPINWGTPALPPKSGGGWPPQHQSGTNASGLVGAVGHAAHRAHASRPVAIRLMVAEACRRLSTTPGTSSDGFHPAQFLLRQLEQMKPPHEPAISLNEMLEICDTEGNPQNGGGSFVIRNDGFQGQSVKFEPADGTSSKRTVTHIGSPTTGHSQLTIFGGIGQPVSKGH